MTYIDVPKTLREKNRIEAEEIFSANAKTAYLGNGRSLCVVLGKYKMYVDTTDIGFSPHMMFDGYWEYWLTKFVADNVAPGHHVMDVGANLGYYTLLLSDIVGPEGTVYGFEPNPALFDMLTSTVTLNGFHRQARLFNAALTDDPTLREVSLFIPENDPKNAAVVNEGFASPRGRVSRVKSMTVETMDIRRLDFIKIDVEGAERRVLGSLMRLKNELRPKIVVEVNFARQYSFDDILALVGYGGELLHIDFDADVQPLTRKMARESRDQEDWLVYWPGKDPGPSFKARPARTSG